jgi:hypothetical protein
MQLRPCIDRVSIQDGSNDCQDHAYETLEVRSIRISKEVVNQAVEEKLGLLLAQYFSHCSSMFVFMSRVTSDEVLKVQVATKACSLEDNLRA